MRIIFVTGLYPKQNLEYYRNNVKGDSLQYAANEFQWRILEGMFHNRVDIHVLSLPFLPCYPSYAKLRTDNSNIYYDKITVGKTISYCTLPIVKEFSMKFRLRKELISYCRQYRDETIYILTYNSSGFMQEVVRPLKKKYTIKLCSIITDLIDDATNPVFKLSFAKYVQAKLEQIRRKKSYDYTDGFILLSKHMTEKIPQASNKNIIVEGIAKSNVSHSIKLKDSRIKSILYTGTLAEFSGVRNLVDAFMRIGNPDYRLVVCGIGELSEYISSCALKDNRIQHMGVVSHERAIALQNDAILLVNPRLPSVSLTKYSFPSKTIEYLLSGTPMIGYKLEGIPDEYFKYIYTPKDYSIESLSDLIECVLNKSSVELYQRALSAREFILNNKSSIKHVEKIISFVTQL